MISSHMEMMNSYSNMTSSQNLNLSQVLAWLLWIKICSKPELVGRILDLKSKSLTDMIWEGWAFVYLFLEMLEFWRILSLKVFKMLHDEFLYDESLKSHHSHIYMLIRLWTIHVLFTAYEHWVWSSSVDPKELVMRLKSRSTCTFTHTCCFYSGSTHPHTSTHFHLQIYPKLFYSYPWENSQKHYRIPVIPREINARDILVITTCYIILGGWVLM